MSQPVQACDLFLQPNQYIFWVKLMFVGVMVMFVGVMNFGQVQKIRFVIVKIFWCHSNQFLVILNWSSELASLSHISIKDIYRNKTVH